MGYQRAQIILSLWAAFAPRSWAPGMPLKNVPKVFVRRVRNFLDRGVGITADRRAGQNVFQEYDVEDAVELGIGLSLQNAGMPQSEIVRFLLVFQQEPRKPRRFADCMVVDAVPRNRSAEAEFCRKCQILQIMFFWGSKRRFSKRSNTSVYNALADPEPNKAEQKSCSQKTCKKQQNALEHSSLQWVSRS